MWGAACVEGGPRRAGTWHWECAAPQPNVCAFAHVYSSALSTAGLAAFRCCFACCGLACCGLAPNENSPALFLGFSASTTGVGFLDLNRPWNLLQVGEWVCV